MWRTNQNTQYPSGFYAVQPPAQTPPVMYQYNNSYQNAAPPSTSNNGRNYHQPTAPISTTLPVPKPWKCGPCELILESEMALQRHTASHITCDECSFQATPKVVKAHHQARHGKFAGSGFKSVTIAIPGCQVQRFRICVGNRPEDIAEWIAERKRRFPRQKQVNKDTQETGLSTLLAGYGSSDEDSTASNQQQQQQQAPTIVEEQPIPNETTQSSDLRKQPLRKRPCRYFVRDGTCRKGEDCTFLHELRSPSLAREAPRNTPAKRPKREPSLLERLLQNDKKRENALTLQLLDYIVETNFLSFSGSS